MLLEKTCIYVFVSKQLCLAAELIQDSRDEKNNFAYKKT